MRFRNSAEGYGIVAQAFHWLIALLVFTQIGLGIYVDDLPLSLARLQWLSRHKSLGLAILILVVFRLAWRGFNPPPPLPGFMPRAERRIARITHALLYVLLIAAPVAGWLHASAAGLGVNFFGWFALPDLVDKNAALSEFFHAAHATLVWTLATLLALHIGGALRHALWLRDGVFQRMLPQWKRSAR